MTFEFKSSSLVNRFEESATLALSGRAKKMAAEGRSIVNFGVGEPDFVTDETIIQRGLDAARAGQTKYTMVQGNLSLRKAIVSRIEEDYGVSYQPDDVLVSAGGKQTIFHFLQAILEPQDEVIILSPYWVSFPEMVKMVGGKPVIVGPALSENPDARVTAAQIAKAITPRTKALILNSPSNPSGQVFTSKEVESFLDVIAPHPIWLLSDDTYYTLTYGNEPWRSAVSLRPSFKERTLIVGSTSKSYAMTGWRLGWGLGPKPLISAMTKLQSQITSNASSVSQAAAEEALGPSHKRVAGALKERFQARRTLILESLARIPGLTWMQPDGAFYVFVRIAPLLKPGKTTTAFAAELLDIHGVCAIPGEAFGEPDYLRLSYALSEAQIADGIQRIEKALKS